jgi:choline monooxygenase
VVYDYFFADLGDPGRRAEREAMIELSNITLDEDQAICEAVQRNLEAGVYHRGELSPKHEEALAWFQGMIAAAVGEVSVAG